MSLKISTWLLCSLVSLLAFQASAQTGKGMVIFADAVYHNGKVLTVDERFSIAQALAVRDGKVMAVGSNAEIINLAGPKTVRLDLKGKSIVPGFIDTHSHLFDYAPANWANDLEVLEPELKQYRQTPLQVKSVADAVAQLKAKVAEAGAGKMIHVQLLPSSVAEEFGNKMMLKEMDELAPSNPIVVQLRGTDRRANSHIFNLFSEYFGALPEEIQTDNQGKPRGPIGSGSMRTLIGEILVKRPQTLAAIYKKELQAWGAHGVTTWSSSLPTVKVFNAFVLGQSRRIADPIRVFAPHGRGRLIRRRGILISVSVIFPATARIFCGPSAFRFPHWTVAIRANARQSMPGKRSNRGRNARPRRSIKLCVRRWEPAKEFPALMFTATARWIGFSM